MAFREVPELGDVPLEPHLKNEYHPAAKVARLSDTILLPPAHSPVPRRLLFSIPQLKFFFGIEFKEEAAEQIQTQHDQTTQLETGLLSSPEEDRAKSCSPEGNCKLQTFRDSDLSLFNSTSKTTSDDITAFIRGIITKMAEAAVKKSAISSSPKERLSPVDKLLDDSCPEVHLYKHSTFTKEEHVAAPQSESVLTKLMRKSAAAHKAPEIALLPVPSAKDPNRQNLRVYLFGTRESVDLVVSKKNKVDEIIRHVIALTMSHAPLHKLFIKDLPEMARADYQNPALYELRLLEEEDDPEEFYLPFYDAGPLDGNKPIGDFSVTGVALCRVKGYRAVLKEITESMYF